MGTYINPGNAAFAEIADADYVDKTRLIDLINQTIEQRPQDYKILSEILGHSNTKITLDLYTHVMIDSKIQAMNAISVIA